MNIANEQPWLSVDREAVSRNASEAIELRHVSIRVVGGQPVSFGEAHVRPLGGEPHPESESTACCQGR
jgi:hypothetical protein